MDATRYIVKIVDGLRAVQLEAILIGNAAAAIQGAPVTTVDLDFYYRESGVNDAKLKKLADHLNARLTRPYPALSSLYRIIVEEDGFHIDFLTVMEGVRSLASLRSRSSRVSIEGRELVVASLEDVIRSKKLAGRPKDLAVMYVLEEALKIQKREVEPGAEADPSPTSE